MRYFQEHWWVGLIILAALIAAWLLVIVARRLMRKRRLARWKALGSRDEFLSAFDHICASLERAQLIERGSKTPLELAVSANESARRLESRVMEKAVLTPIDADADKDNVDANGANDTRFAQLAACFARVSYGAAEPSDSELSAAESYVELLPKRLSKTIGHARYLRQFFHV